MVAMRVEIAGPMEVPTPARRCVHHVCHHGYFHAGATEGRHTEDEVLGGRREIVVTSLWCGVGVRSELHC